MTLNDISVCLEVMEIGAGYLAKTFRYLDEEEIAKQAGGG